MVLLPTPPLPELTAMIFFTSGSICPTSGREAVLNSVSMVTSTSCPQWYLMAASVALTVDFRKGSVSRGKVSTTFTFQGSPSLAGAATAGVSATISLSMRFFFVPAYVTVASASRIILGNNTLSIILFFATDYTTFTIIFISPLSPVVRCQLFTSLSLGCCAWNGDRSDSHRVRSPPQALRVRPFVAVAISYI